MHHEIIEILGHDLINLEISKEQQRPIEKKEKIVECLHSNDGLRKRIC